MMALPNAQIARVDVEKIRDYLLCDTHPDGRCKAAFFLRFGFHLEVLKKMVEALRRHAIENPVISRVDSLYGVRYTVEGPLESPDGRNPRVITVWIIERDKKVPRLITAYPAKGGLRS